MKAVNYSRSWSGNMSQEEEMAAKFGKELHFVDTAGPWEVSESYLFNKGTKYYLLEANGCSCWDGDYDGWELTKTELMKLVNKKLSDDRYLPDYEKQMAEWIKENI